MLLKVENVAKSYGRKRVLSGVSLFVSEGEIVGILGPSGGGKSTLVKIISGLEEADSGSVSLHGRLGYVPQQDSFYPFLTVAENIGYFAALRGEALGKGFFGLDPDQQASELSGGQRKRLSIACALTGGPDLLILDEPTVGLDPVSKRDVLSFLAGLGTACLIVTHLMNEAEELCDKVILLSGGVVSDSGSPAALRRRHKAKDLEEVFVKVVNRSVSSGPRKDG